MTLHMTLGLSLFHLNSIKAFFTNFILAILVIMYHQSSADSGLARVFCISTKNGSEKSKDNFSLDGVLLYSSNGFLSSIYYPWLAGFYPTAVER